MKNHFQYHLSGRESSSCKEVVDKDWETQTRQRTTEKVLLKNFVSEKQRPSQWQKRARTLSGVAGWGWGCTWPLLCGRWTARILQIGLLWSHWFISPDSWTNRECSFNLEFPRCRERWNRLLLYDRNASPLMVNPSFPLLLGGSCAALDPGYSQNALDSGKYVEEAFTPLWTQRYIRHG